MKDIKDKHLSLQRISSMIFLEEFIFDFPGNDKNQINELELVPMFVRYTYKETNRDDTQEESHPVSVHVSFQKEVFAEKWNMVHVTEISFTVNYEDFYEFEKMSGVSLTDDFRNLTATQFNGKQCPNGHFVHYRRTGTVQSRTRT